MQRELVERATRGDHEAFSELARLSVDRLYATARLILRDTERAEDAVQDGFVRAWQRIRTLRDPERFDAWMRRIVVNECYRLARHDRDRLRREVQLLPVFRSSANIGEALADRDEIEQAFRRLDSHERALIVLHFYLGLADQEAADSLGIPLGTYKSRLHRSTQMLRASIDADARTPRVLTGRTS